MREPDDQSDEPPEPPDEDSRPREPHALAEYRKGLLGLPPAGRLRRFIAESEEFQQACWEDLARFINARRDAG